MTMKEFLEKDYFQLLMGVEGLGDLLGIGGTELLSRLRLERLCIAVRDIASLDQLAGIVTGEGFRFLVFTDMHLISTDDNSIAVVEGDSIAVICCLASI